MTPGEWEAAITMLLLIGFAIPVAYLTPLTMTYAALIGVFVVVALNIAYWKWRGTPIREVYGPE